jgi:hypothetical protein
MDECRRLLARWWALSIAVAAMAAMAGSSLGCGGGSDAGGGNHGGGSSSGGGSSGGGSSSGGGTVVEIKPGDPGNPDGHCTIPSGAWLEDSSTPTTVVGTGTPESCTGDLFIAAVAKGGVITFDCGPDPVTIKLTRPAKVLNLIGSSAVQKVVIDGGGKVVLSGEGRTRILYMNTCDQAQGWATSHCDNQATPQLTVQNITFANGSARSEPVDRRQLDGGGAIFASGGRLKVVNSRFLNNVGSEFGPDVGGGAIQAFQQYSGLPVYVVNSTFGAEGMGNACANGGALSSIGVSWTVLNSVIRYNRATGTGASSGRGGNGGGIYNDGNAMTLSVCGTQMDHNNANAFGRAIFFVSNNGTGTVAIDQSVITGNTGSTSWERKPQISMDDGSSLSVSADSVIHD